MVFKTAGTASDSLYLKSKYYAKFRLFKKECSWKYLYNITLFNLILEMKINIFQTHLNSLGV